MRGPAYHTAHRRRGITMLELVCAVTLIGICGAIAMSRLSSSTKALFNAQGDARRLALDLLQTQRRAITTGLNHYITFTSSGGKIVSYTLMQRNGASTTAVDAVHTFDTLLTVTSTATDLEYQFDGSTLAAYTVTIAGGGTTFTITVNQVTGNVKVT